MSKRFKPLPVLEGRAGRRASDPNVHAALSASAGTGKTQVLTARVLRLLLNGADPKSILCLTFTKAGAAEMANRIGARLAAWVRMKDHELGADLIALGEPIPARRRASARGGCSPRCSKRPAACGSRPSTASRRRCSRRSRRKRGSPPVSSRSRGAPSRSWPGPRSPIAGRAEARGDESLIADVQCLSLRLGEEGAVDYLMRCARGQMRMAALGPADEIEPVLRARWTCRRRRSKTILAHHCDDERFDCDLLRGDRRREREMGRPDRARPRTDDRRSGCR